MRLQNPNPTHVCAAVSAAALRGGVIGARLREELRRPPSFDGQGTRPEDISASPAVLPRGACAVGMVGREGFLPGGSIA